MSDPELFLFFYNSWVLKFLRVAKEIQVRIQVSLTNCGGAMEQEASAYSYIVFRCVGISECLCIVIEL